MKPLNRVILTHLIRHGAITQQEALSLYGCQDVSKRISELRLDSGIGIRAYRRKISEQSFTDYRLSGLAHWTARIRFGNLAKR